MQAQHQADKNGPVVAKAPPAGGPRRITAWVVAAGLLVAAGWGTTYLFPATKAQAAVPAALPEVTVATPLVRQLATQMGVLGQFSAVDEVELRPQVGGTLTGIYFRDGDVVQQGALLFTIDPKPYEIRLARAKAQLEMANARLVLANSELRRAQALEQGSAGTVQNVEQRRADRQVALAEVAAGRAAVDDAQFDLDHCRILAPVTGRISNHLVSVGNLVAGSRAATSPTTLLATLVSLDPIYLNFDLSEADYQRLMRYRAANPGKSADGVELALASDKQYARSGKFDFINNAIDRASGTIHARATVPNPGMQLTPGEFARVRVNIDQPSTTLLVPDAAVLPDQSQHIVMVVDKDNVVTPRVVQVGDLRDGLRVVSSGISQQDRVIIAGLPYATPGAKVNTKAGAITTGAGPAKD